MLVKIGIIRHQELGIFMSALGSLVPVLGGEGRRSWVEGRWSIGHLRGHLLLVIFCKLNKNVVFRSRFGTPLLALP